MRISFKRMIAAAPRNHLIVTADDLGYSEERDDGIIRAFRSGVVRNASLLVSGASAASALRRALDAGICVGLHLNLTEGRPVSTVGVANSLLGPPEHRVFRGKFGFREALLRGEIHQNDIAAEAAAQFARFIALHPSGLGPAYLDGHQHIHVLPAVVSAIVPLLKGYSVPAVRIPSLSPAEDITALETTRRVFYAGIDADCSAARTAFSHVGVWSPRSFIGFVSCAATRGSRRVLDTLARLGEDSAPTEWMTHPGLKTLPVASERRPPEAPNAGCGDGPDDFSMSDEREEELSVVCDPALIEGLLNLGWRPASFAEAMAS